MKKLLTSMIAFLHELGKVRAASELARLGHYVEARAVLLSK